MNRMAADLRDQQKAVTAAYSSSSVGVRGLLGTQISPSDPDRAVIEPWAATVDGRILDVGSGTGRWAGHLTDLGYQTEGLEPADPLLGLARERFPSVVFHHGTIADLAGTSARWGGILAWYSTIHLKPEELPEALQILRSVLNEEGLLLMSFFTGPALAAFAHPVATAFLWPMDHMARLVTEAGFEVLEKHASPAAPHAYLRARVAPVQTETSTDTEPRGLH